MGWAVAPIATAVESVHELLTQTGAGEQEMHNSLFLVQAQPPASAQERWQETEGGLLLSEE